MIHHDNRRSMPPPQGQPHQVTNLTSFHPATATPNPGEWFRVVWRSPTPIAPGTQLFARVRTIMP